MHMLKKHLLAAACLSALMGAGAANAYTAVVSIAPPPPRHETMPAHRPGHVWAPGHYELRNNHYVWISGHWLREREGYAYREPHWVQRRNGDWVMVGGTWERVHARGPQGDRDRDGIANRYDRDKDGDGIRNRNDPHPNRPDAAVQRKGPNGDLDRDGIANRDDRDKDGDGVRNRNDSAPGNANRS
jgi:hypothetical protein